MRYERLRSPWLRTSSPPRSTHDDSSLSSGVERVDAVTEAASALRALLGDRRIVNVNSTATGGGVAEMLATLLGYVRGIGLEADWLVIAGDPEFFAVTKRIHNGLYGSPGDGGELGTRERAIYERTIAANLEPIRREVRSGDVVIVHDPQPAGLIAPLVDVGAHVVWRCHVGYDGANEWTDRAWAFIRPYVEAAHAHVFSRESFAPEWIDRALAARDSTLDRSVHSQEPGARAKRGALRFLAPRGSYRRRRSAGRASAASSGRRAGGRSARSADVPLVVQVSRWDRMKDMPGVLDGFARYVHTSNRHTSCWPGRPSRA